MINTDTIRRDSGFTLVELLVALAIGVIGSLLMMQIFSQSERGRRALGALSDSQSSGVIGRFTIERDLQQAGLGVMNLNVLGCKVRSNDHFSGNLLSPMAIIPDGVDAASNDNVWHVPPGDAGSDMVAILVGSSAVMLEGTPLVSSSSGNDYPFENTYGLSPGDRIVVSDGSHDCTMAELTLADPANGKVTLDWNYGISYDGSASAYSLGRTARAVVYAVRSGRLTVCDFFQNDCSDAGKLTDQSVWLPVASDVVALVAQYGWDTTMLPNVTVADKFCKSRLTAGGVCPDSDTGSPAAGNALLAQSARACDWTRVPMVRVALVTRSGQYEKEEVSPASIKLWPDSATSPTTTGPTFAPLSLGTDGRHFRYRVSYSQVALRNLLWSRVSSCL